MMEDRWMEDEHMKDGWKEDVRRIKDGWIEDEWMDGLRN